MSLSKRNAIDFLNPKVDSETTATFNQLLNHIESSTSSVVSTVGADSITRSMSSNILMFSSIERMDGVPFLFKSTLNV